MRRRMEWEKMRNTKRRGNESRMRKREKGETRSKYMKTKKLNGKMQREEE